MKTIAVSGKYQLIQYSEDFICLDHVTKSLGMTLEVFDNVSNALAAFQEKIKGVGKMKTGEEWGKLRLDMYEYLQVGDIVDHDIYNHFLNVMPPACQRKDLIQIGEPYSHRQGKLTYATLKKENGNWIFCGNCFYGTSENIN